MKRMQRQDRIWALLALITLILAAYYVWVYRPLSERTDALDEPLRAAWERLLKVSAEHGSLENLKQERITPLPEEVQAAAAALIRAGDAINARIKLEPLIEERMRQPFQLIDFQNERQARVEKLTQLAQTNAVTLDPAVPKGFPEFVFGFQPDLLWAQLGISHQLVNTAVLCKVGKISRVYLPTPNLGGSTNNAGASLVEVPVRIDITGPQPAIANFLAALPLRVEEAKEKGLPELSPDKPALFINQIMLRKGAPENPDEVVLELQVSGFVYRRPLVVPQT